MKGEDMPLILQRNGYPELCHFTFSYSPIRNMAGRIDGMFTAAVETSERVLAERRQAFQLRLADALRVVNDPVEIAERAAAMLGEHIEAGRAGYGIVDTRQQTVRVDGGWTDGRMSSLSGESRALDSFGPAIIAELKAGRTLRLDDIGTDPRSAPYAEGYASIGTKSLVVVPLLKHGELKAILYLHGAAPRAWTAGDVAIAEDVARRTRDAIERADAERELRSERVRLQTIVDTIPTGLIMLDDSGAMVLENAEWRRTWAGTGAVNAVVDYERYKGFRPDTGERIAADEWPCAMSLKQGVQTRDVILDIERFDGTRGTIVVSSAPVRDAAGRVVAAVAANMDISELRAAQARLLEADRRKDEFLAMLAHELRNPLAPILTAAEMLGTVARDATMVNKASVVIARQARHLTALVDDLLDVSRVTRGLVELDREVVDLGSIIDSSVEQTRPLLETRKHTLTVRAAAYPSVIGDRNRLVQIVANLLSNAAKYTPDHGRIILSVRTVDTCVLVEVEDNGIGVEPSLLPHIFELFTQAERTPDRSQGGLGIGLALVKTIVELHDGEVVAHSAGRGHGSKFTVSLPMTG